MRVLLLSNTPFLPPDAGNRRRIDRMIDYLGSHGAEVGMLLLPDPEAGPVDVEGMARRLGYFEVGTPPPRGRVGGRMARVARRLASGLRRPGDAGLDAWCPPWFRARAQALVREWRPDVVLVEYVFLSVCLESLAGAGAYRPLGVIDTHDLMHRRRDAYAAAGLPARWFRTTYEEERRGLLRADVVLAISEGDAEVLRRMLPERTVVRVPHGEALQPAPPEDAAPARLLFVASYNDLNVAALRWFLATAWEQLREAHPQLELVVCGTIAAKLGKVPPGVSLRGFVPSLAGEYARARVVIDPVRGATGLQVKIVEALCHGRPVVSAGAAARPMGPGDGLLVADEPVGFARTIGQLLEDDDAWRCACQAAAARAAREFSPEAAFGALRRHLEGARTVRLAAQTPVETGLRRPRH